MADKKNSTENLHPVGASENITEPDVKQLTNLLIKLLDEPQLCKEMGENGQRLVMDKFTSDKIADRMIKLYETILLKNGKKGIS